MQDDDVVPEDSLTPVLPLRDVVVYPHMVIPLFVGRAKSVRALDQAMQKGKRILLVAQKNAEVDDPGIKDIYNTGTIANILQLLKLPDGTIKVLVEGMSRCHVDTFSEVKDYLAANATELTAIALPVSQESEILVRSVSGLFEQYVKLNKKIPQEILNSLATIDDPARIADTISAHMPFKLNAKQDLLETQEVAIRLEKILGLIEGELDVLQIEKKIRGRVKQQVEKTQREYYLNEQMKAIQKELGDLEDAVNEADEFVKKIEQAKMPKEAKEKAMAELAKFKMMSPMSAEATVVRNYIDWLVNIPWRKRTKVRNNIKEAESILEKDHYGLEKVKERIVEYLAVQQRVQKIKGPILCLVGPPGVGKTSLGQSIARATNRKFTKMSLGGVRDEAEIRGHRRTYIGSLPGKIVQNLVKIKTRNPLFLLDEIDKMSMDFRGDPASALLEVLDPEQNHAFADHYLEVDVDLSDIMFVATANTLNLPPALLDRLEVIRIPGYTEDEKIDIATRYLIPKQYKNHGLDLKDLTIGEASLQEIIRYYTREAGLRNLEREIAKICRKVVKEEALKPRNGKRVLVPKSLEHYLGVRRFRFGRADEKDRIGQVVGLAWTEVGGELLTIESVVLPGKGSLSHTGQLGNVMQESIQAAMIVVRSRASLLGLKNDFYQECDIHVHVPEGATPKDGPSAGIGMCTAVVSALTKIPVKSTVAMTGEITLRGEVLPIGGLKEKLLAAHRGGIETVIIPEENRKDLVDIPKNIKGSLDIRPVQWIDEVFRIALQHLPEPVTEEEDEIVATASKSRKGREAKKDNSPPRAH